jgi:hypothetical protein
MVDGNCWIGKFDIVRDGIHRIRRGAKKIWESSPYSHSFLPSGKRTVKAVEVVEKNICPGLCKNTMQTSELQSPKIETDITHQGKNITQTGEVQCSKIENDTGHKCSATTLQHLRGEVQCLKIETEMDHLNSNTKNSTLEMIYVLIKIL